MRLLIKFLFLLITLTSFGACRVVGALAMAREEKTTVDTWETDNFKVRIQKRQGWAGPYYYHCRVKEKKTSGLYYKTIVSATFSRETYSTCIINYPLHQDTLSVDICNKKTFFKSKGQQHLN